MRDLDSGGEGKEEISSEHASVLERSGHSEREERGLEGGRWEVGGGISSGRSSFKTQLPA